MLQDIRSNELFIAIPNILLHQNFALKYLRFIATKILLAQTYFLKFYCNTCINYCNDFDVIAMICFGGKLNPSLLDLKHLNYFVLSFNNISASPIPEFLGSIKSLTSLNLSISGFVGVIPHQLGNLSNLLYLNHKSSIFPGLYVNNL